MQVEVWSSRPSVTISHTHTHKNKKRDREGPQQRAAAGTERLVLCILMEAISHRRACCRLLYELNVLIHSPQKHESPVHIILVYG